MEKNSKIRYLWNYIAKTTNKPTYNLVNNIVEYKS